MDFSTYINIYTNQDSKRYPIKLEKMRKKISFEGQKSRI